MNCNSSDCLCIAHHDKLCKYDTSDVEQETESQRLLRQMVHHQLSTNITLREQFERHKSFTAGEMHVPLTAAGTSTLADFVTADTHKKKMEELLSSGLTNEEADFYIKHTGLIQSNEMHTNMEPSALKERMKAIREQLERGESENDTITDEMKKPGLPKDPMSHVMEFSKSLMERVNARKKRVHKNKGKESPGVEARTPPPDTMRLHAVVPLPEAEISANKLSVDEIRHLPRFRDYDAGVKSDVLYLKNLHPKVDVRELMALFLRFDKDADTVTYRLLSGRYRGQAFVTFPDADSAERAMALCNGYLLRSRPVVIEYGKKAK